MCCDVVSDDTCDNCIDVGAAMESTAHSIHCSDDTSDSHELPPLAAVAEGEHCILVWLYRSTSASIMWYHDNTESV